MTKMTVEQFLRHFAKRDGSDFYAAGLVANSNHRNMLLSDARGAVMKFKDGLKISVTRHGMDRVPSKHSSVYVEVDGKTVARFINGKFEWLLHSSKLESHVRNACANVYRALMPLDFKKHEAEKKRREERHAKDQAFDEKWGIRQ